MIPKSLHHRILIKGDKRKIGELENINVIGASTSSARLQIENDNNKKIYLDTVSGNDSNDGLTPSTAKLTYSAAASLVDGSSKTTIEVVNNGAVINDTLTKPTQMAISAVGILYNEAYRYAIWNNAATPSFSTTRINAVCFSNELTLFVAVGDDGKIGYSSDGDTWTQATSPFGGSERLSGVCYAAGAIDKFVAVSESNQIAYSSNGSSWTLTASHPFSATGILGVAYSYTLDRLVAVGTNGEIAYSDNAINWTSATTSSFLTKAIRAVCYSEALQLFVAVGSSGKIAYSSDGDVWVQAATPSFPSSKTLRTVLWSDAFNRFYAADPDDGDVRFSFDGNVWQTGITGSTVLRAAASNNNAVVGGNRYSVDGTTFTATTSFIPHGLCWAESLNIFLKVGDNGSIRYTNGQPPTLQNAVCGFSVGDTPVIEADILNNTFNNEPTINADADIINNRFNSGLTIDDNAFNLFSNLIIGNVTINTVPLSADVAQINQNTIVGDVEINNTGQNANGFQIRDNIIEGSIDAIENVNMQSGNIRGTINNVTLIDARSDDPLFIDVIDYKLRYEVLGYDFDSSLVKASRYYTRPDGIARDMGCYNISDANLVETFLDSAWLTRPNSMQIGNQAEAWTDKGVSGEIDGYNDTKMLSEEVVLTWNGMHKEVYEFFNRQMRRKNTKVFLSLYPNNLINLSPIVVDGNHSIYDVVLNIQPTTIYFGDILKIDEQEYFVLFALDANGKKTTINAVKLILDRPLHIQLDDTDTIQRKYPVGFGEYSYRVEAQQPYALAGLNGDVVYNIQARFVKNNGVNS